ncbi:D-alanine--D-alanine ligase family protein [Streptomyces murinus]
MNDMRGPRPGEVSSPIAVITGGWSQERDRSLLSGEEVIKALAYLGVDVRVIDLRDDHRTLVGQLQGVSAAFLAIAGRGAEDGRLQGLLETLGIPYTGSGVRASALGMHKITAKTIVASAGVPVPDGCAVEREAKPRAEASRLAARLGLPVIVKPVSEGGSIGLRVIQTVDELADAILGADSDLMAEVFHPGRSVSVGVLADETTGTTQVLPPLEAEAPGGIYSYDAKRSQADCTYFCPARVSSDTLMSLTLHAVTAHRALGCHSYSRHDFVVPTSGDPLWLEVNTLPGLTRGGNLARMAAVAGMAYEDLVAHILRGAVTDRRALA